MDWVDTFIIYYTKFLCVLGLCFPPWLSGLFPLLGLSVHVVCHNFNCRGFSIYLASGKACFWPDSYVFLYFFFLALCSISQVFVLYELYSSLLSSVILLVFSWTLQYIYIYSMIMINSMFMCWEILSKKRCFSVC